MFKTSILKSMGHITFKHLTQYYSAEYVTLNKMGCHKSKKENLNAILLSVVYISHNANSESFVLVVLLFCGNLFINRPGNGNSQNGLVSINSYADTSINTSTTDDCEVPNCLIAKIEKILPERSDSFIHLIIKQKNMIIAYTACPKRYNGNVF